MTAIAVPFRWVYNCPHLRCVNVIAPRWPPRRFCAEHSPPSEFNFIAFHEPVFRVNAQLAFYLGRCRRMVV